MKKKVLFLSMHRPGRSPGQRFRFEQYISFLEANGYICKHSFLLDEKTDRFYYKPGNYLKKILVVIKATFKRLKEALSNDFDLIFVHRECYMLGSVIFERIFSRKSKMIFDFDDAIWMRQTGESQSGNKLFYFLKAKKKTKKLIHISDMVFAGNRYLFEYALSENKNVKIVPTTIDTAEYIKIEVPGKNPHKICIGWSGSFSTITFFTHSLPALYEIKKKYGDKVYFKVIGDGSYRNDELNIKGLPWKKDTEVYDLSEIDIGIMPLPNDEWTKGKCGLKGLQYMALGIPTIMSPVGVNSEIIKDGINGFLAGDPEEWVAKLSMLIESEQLRIKLGMAGSETVENMYSVNANRELYLKYFNELLN